MEDEKKKEAKEKTFSITPEKVLLVDGKKKKLKGFDDFLAPEETKASIVNLDKFVKTKVTVEYGSINFNPIYQGRISDGAIAKLIPSIAESGLLTPFVGTISDNPNQFDCLDGFTRQKAIEALRNPEILKKLGFENLVITKKFDFSTPVDMIIYTKQDGSRIDEADCFAISGMSNTIRESWNVVDIAHYIKPLLKRELYSAVTDLNPQAKEYVDSLFENGTPLLILNALLHASILTKNQIGSIKEKVYKSLEKTTGLSVEDLQVYSRLAEIPEIFFPVLTGQRNPWGLVISPKNAISLFFDEKGNVRSESAITRILNALKAKTNPMKKGVKKVSGADIQEVKQGDGASKKIRVSEKVVATLLIDLYSKNISLPIKSSLQLMEKMNNAKDLPDFVSYFNTLTNQNLPTPERFVTIR